MESRENSFVAALGRGCRAIAHTAPIVLGLLLSFEQVAWANAQLPAFLQRDARAEAQPSVALQKLLLQDTLNDVAKLAEEQQAKKGAEGQLLADVAKHSTPTTSAPRGAAIGPDPGEGYVRLPGHVLDALAQATPIAPEGIVPLSPEASAQQQELTLTLVLKRDDQAGFERYMKEVYNPKSKLYRHFLTQARLTKQFGPSRRSYELVLSYLRKNGFELVEGSKNRLTLTVSGTRSAVEHAFDLSILDFQLGISSSFYASNADPAIPRSLEPYVAAIAGLSNFGRPRNVTVDEALNYCSAVTGLFSWVPVTMVAASIIGISCTLVQLGRDPNNALNYCGIAGSFGLLGAVVSIICTGIQIGMDPWPGFYAHNGPFGGGGGGSFKSARKRAKSAVADMKRIDGSGQTVGILSFDTFRTSDVADYLSVMGAPQSLLANVTSVPVNGGVTSPGSGETEVLLDVDSVLSIAPGAKVVVYNAPFDGRATSYAALFNAMINGGVDVISNSWASCEDQVSRADAEAIDAVLQSAAATGIGVFNAAGDTGSVCLDGSPDTVAVPADSPHATAVGGSSLSYGPGFTYGSETWWNNQGGFGLSRYFSRPAYQDGVSTSTMRSVPDVVVNADPASGIIICQASDGGCPTGKLHGGTSIAAPIWAGFAAVLNEANGSNFGALNPLMYPFAGTAAFHNPASMGSDFQHVGLGSPNLDVVLLKLNGQTAGAVDAESSSVHYDATAVGGKQQLPVVSVPADGSTQAILTVILRDVNGHTVSGKSVSLTADSVDAVVTPINAVTTVNNGAALFAVTDLKAESVTFTAVDIVDGVTISKKPQIIFGVPVAASAGLNVFPNNVVADGSSTTTLAVTLKDSLNRPTPGKLIEIHQGSGHSLISGPNPAVTDATGKITFTAKDKINESVTYTATDVSDDLPIPGTGTVNFSGAGTSCVPPAPTAVPGYVLTPFATGFDARDFFEGGINFTECQGASNLAFDASGNLYVSEITTGGIYKFGPGGGTATMSNRIGTVAPGLGGIAFTPDGRFYAGKAGPGNIYEIDPVTGATLRTVASNVTLCLDALSPDPLSQDLFVSDGCGIGGNAAIMRVANPASATPTVSTYASAPEIGSGQIAFSPDGTFYVVTSHDTKVLRVSGTNKPQPASAVDIGVVSDGAQLAVGSTSPDGSAKSLILTRLNSNSSGSDLGEYDIASGGFTTLVNGGPASLGGSTIGPDGCYYVAIHDTVYKLTPASGSCTSTAANAQAVLTLSPGSIAPNPAQGTSKSFTATLRNVASPAGIPVFFSVAGANPQIKMVRANATGQAILSYTAVNPGADTVVASATIDTPPAGKRLSSSKSFVAPPASPTSANNSKHYTSSVVPAGGNYPAATTDRAFTANRPRASIAKAAKAASATTTTLTSNAAHVIWDAGAHVTFLTLNPSPTSGTRGQVVTVVASLSDVSANPAVPVAGQFVDFALGSATCRGTTNAQGIATCSLTPGQVGSDSLTATFAGTSQQVASSATVGFRTLEGAPVPGECTDATVTVQDLSGQPITFSVNRGSICVQRVDQPGGAPNGLEYPFGFFAYTVTGLFASSAVTMTVTVPPQGNGKHPDAWIDCVNGSCYRYGSASFVGNVVTVQLQDNGQGDRDATSGRISGVAAPADNKRSSSGGLSLGLLIFLFTAALARRRLRPEEIPR